MKLTMMDYGKAEQGWRYTDDYRNYLNELGEWKRQRREEGKRLYKEVTADEIGLNDKEAEMNDNLIKRQNEHKLKGRQEMSDYMFKNGEYFVTYGYDKYGAPVTTRKWRGRDANGNTMTLDVGQASGRVKGDAFVNKEPEGFRDLLTDNWAANASRMLGKDMSFTMTDDEKALQKRIKDKKNDLVRKKLADTWEMNNAKPFFDVDATKKKYLESLDANIKAGGSMVRKSADAVNTSEDQIKEAETKKEDILSEILGGDFLKGLDATQRKNLERAMLGVHAKEEAERKARGQPGAGSQSVFGRYAGAYEQEGTARSKRATYAQQLEREREERDWLQRRRKRVETWK